MLFRVLGPIEVDGPDGAVRLSAEKPRRLLSALLLQPNTWVTVDALIGELWPAGPPASAPGNIKTYVSQLRRVLPPAAGTTERIERRPGAYRVVVARTELDATIFEDLVNAGEAALAAGDPAAAAGRLTDALALWRGAAYGSLDAERAGSASQRLHELRWMANDRLAAALIATGRGGEAIAVLRQLTAEDPLREPAWIHLMEALHASGRRADALHAYQEARRSLVDALGVEPGVELQHLHLRLLQEPTVRLPPDEPAPRAATVSPIDRSRPARSRRRPLTLARISALVAITVAVLVAVSAAAPSSPKLARGAHPAVTAPPVGDPPPGVAPRRPIPGLPTPGSASVLFGAGSQANAALASGLVRESPVGMLTTWFHEPKNLNALRGWRADLVPRAYRDGYALHLVLADWHEEAERPVDTRYGPGCGRPYALSAELRDHARELAAIFAGQAHDPPLYVTVFHGVNIYGCDDGAYQNNPTTAAYLRALQDQYLQIRDIFHQGAPNARVAVGWQGWQADDDDPDVGGGRSMFGHLAAVLRASDFQSVVVWQPEDNVEPVRQMVPALGAYGPVLVMYGNSSSVKPEVYDRDVRTLLTDDSLTELTGAGMFAWNFAESTLATSPPPTLEFVKATIHRNGRRSR